MPFSQEQLNELNLLALFHSSSSQEGIKVHKHSADPATVAAAERLYTRGLVTQPDGGYLTPLGSEITEQVHKLQSVLNSKP
ncbi:TIGR02647 family protein [Gilvimarinus sp. 1_MG-2023]|uniref:TIGR02647 family protein n=1 Tax=Gilvimarinus sp. 1_MG-2023 TaxID=3062638 RepID=UPI0026E226D0|nr:TIGR02647 family protein [Gilvimarinus sp. 1_MG-2023]MDO6747814.1 TIGR02647 family protein [Gilvimarinus sp. 1_MG-2023]